MVRGVKDAPGLRSSLILLLALACVNFPRVEGWKQFLRGQGCPRFMRTCPRGSLMLIGLERE